MVIRDAALDYSDWQLVHVRDQVDRKKHTEGTSKRLVLLTTIPGVCFDVCSPSRSEKG